jgi:membrane-associated phospholipid phosphatase
MTKEDDIVAQPSTTGHRVAPGVSRRRLAAAAVLGLAFVALTLAVTSSAHAFAIDVEIHEWLMAHRTPALTTVALAVTATGASGLVVPAVLVLSLLAGRGSGLERLLPAVLATGVLLLGIGLRLVVSNLVARERPPRADWAGFAHGYAFPSGHTTTSALAAGVLIWVASGRLTGGLLTAVTVVLAAWAVSVGLTRAYLGVHWPTDVLGGWLLALTWLSLATALLAGRGGGVPQDAVDPGVAR